MISSTQKRRTPMLIPAVSGMLRSFSGFLSSDANAILLFARVFILIPNQATLYEPRIPTTVHPRMSNTPPADWC